MSKITLNNVASLIDATTAQNTINANSATVQTAMDNTLSRDGTQPNQMGANIDMNNNQILNLAPPATLQSPLRLTDASQLTNTGTIVLLPAGGTTGQALEKTSNTDYAVGWNNVISSVGLSLPNDFTVTNSPITTSGTLTATYANGAPTGSGAFVRQLSPIITGLPQVNSSSSVAFAVGPNGNNNPCFSVDDSTASAVGGINIKGAATGGNNRITATDSGANASIQLNAKGTGSIVLGGDNANQNIFLTGASGTTSVTLGLVNNSGGSLAIAGGTSGSTTIIPTGVASGTLTLPAATDQLVGRATTDILTNKTYDTAGTGNVFKINTNQISSNTGSGSVNVLQTSPNLLTPTVDSSNIGMRTVIIRGVNFNSANTDTTMTIPLPSGITRYVIYTVYVSNASQTLTTATAGIFSGAGGTGTTIVSNTPITVSTASANTAANIQGLNPGGAGAAALNFGTLFFRVGTAQGAAATADVIFIYIPLS